MKNTLIVVADLGCLKAFRVEKDGANRPPRLRVLEEFQNAEAHGKLVERVTDLAGRFPRGTGMRAGGAMSDGERHNIELEARKRMVRQLAQRVNALARERDVESCLLAVSKEINHLLIEELEPEVRLKIGRNLAADLTKLAGAEILARF
jgi:hypothetical protein